jgi:hypothetical protein
MAHLWIKDSGNLAAFPLRGDAFSLLLMPPRKIVAPEELSRVVLLKTTGSNGAAWVIVAVEDHAVYINEFPLKTGVRALEDKDYVWVEGAGEFYFSTERLACPEPFSDREPQTFCPRCKQEIAEGQTAVRCPECQSWHHQTEDLGCWTYSDHCALCPRPTQLGAGYQWVPEEW